MNNSVKKEFCNELDIIIKNFRVCLNNLNNIKEKIKRMGVSKEVPIYLGVIPKFIGKDIIDLFSYDDIDNIYEQTSQVYFNLIDILNSIKNNENIPISDLRIFIALSFVLDANLYEKIFKYFLELIKNNAKFYINNFSRNHLIERKIANLIGEGNFISDDYKFISYIREWLFSFYSEYPSLIDYEVLNLLLNDSMFIIDALIKFEVNKGYYLVDNEEVRPLYSGLSKVVADNLENEFKMAKIRNNDEYIEFMKTVSKITNNELVIQIYDARCRFKMDLNKGVLRKLKKI